MYPDLHMNLLKGKLMKWDPVQNRRQTWETLISKDVELLVEAGTEKQKVKILEFQISEAIEFRNQINKEILRLSNIVERLKSLNYQLESAVRDS